MRTTSLRADAAQRPRSGFHRLPPHMLEYGIKVELVGVGGTGSQVLTGLACLHLGMRALGHPHGLCVRVYDADRVSEANIGRQLFYPGDIGQYKAHVLVTRLNVGFGLSWEAFPYRYEPAAAASIPDADIVISCVDTGAARRGVAEVIASKQAHAPTYWLDCGNDEQFGQVYLTEPQVNDASIRFAPGRDDGVFGNMGYTSHSPVNHADDSALLPELQDLAPQFFDESILDDDRPSCSLAEALKDQGLYINRHVATWALTLLERLIRNGRTEMCGYTINLDDGIVLPITIAKAWERIKMDRQYARCQRKAAARTCGRRAGTNG